MLCHSLCYIPKPYLSLHLPLCCHNSLPYIASFDIKMIHQRYANYMLTCIMLSSMSLLQNDFVLFHNVTWCTNLLLSCIHDNTTNVLDITCVLIATCVILGRLECTAYQMLDTQLAHATRVPLYPYKLPRVKIISQNLKLCWREGIIVDKCTPHSSNIESPK